ncbi:polyketide synthase [Coniella lustricola]|uniref:Polyketide synthase n=1 Tax=Coniella lustricola TaxID=2025994 RepID=A0A2T2ZYZ6_9PEZI|nr:polyketide synthase [Coniella lustricola]
MHCRFAGEATSPSKLWDLCTGAKDAWTPIPKERFDAAGLFDKRKSKRGRIPIEGGYFLQNIDQFDSAFYSYTTDTANAMDPQIRMFLESVYESVEDAGIPIQSLAGSNTAVFAGSFCTDYAHMTLKDPYMMHDGYLTGNGIAMVSNRVSHFYDFQGVSMTLDVGCSTSLVALHQAVQALRSGESDLAVVGSSHITLSPDMFIAMSNSSVLGPSGKCFAWDDRAEGYGRGEGVASVLLKPLAAALRDGDRVHAVVRETGVNQDGKTPTITSPSMEAQVKLIRDVYQRAGLNPSADTGYVEAHMTGTPTGDPIEAEALARTFGVGRAEDDPVLVGSVKPNIGHTEPVSGLAAVIKTVFALREGVIPPNVNYEKTNPKILLRDWRLTTVGDQVPRELTPWPADRPRRASINNFGYGGTNTHVILEAPPPTAFHPSDGNEPSSKAVNGNTNAVTNEQTNGHANGESNNVADEHRSLVYILSAKDSSVASQMGKNLAAYLDENSEPPSPLDLAFTLAERKSRFLWTVAVRSTSLAELASKLADPDRKPVRSTKVPRLGFVFNGQGAQWHAMGRELIKEYPVFRKSLLEADKILKNYGAKWSLHEELLRDDKATRVHEIRLSQPVSVALQLCLVDLLASWAIHPSAVTSHSSGEIAAAYAVGALTFEQALGVVYFRGELAEKHQREQGAMLAAGLGAEAAATYIKNLENGKVVVACHNSPESVTLSGDTAAIDEVEALLTADGVFARKLNVPLAYHSHHMQAMASDYTEALHEILQPAPSHWSGVLFASPVTGGLLSSPKTLTAEHFVRNLVSPVLFSQAFEAMCFDSGSAEEESTANIDVIVEIGAHGTLAGPIRQILKARGSASMPYVSVLKRGSNAVHTAQDAACSLLAQGVPVSLASVNAHEQGKFVPGLPAYAWNHAMPHWTESRLSKEYRHKRFRPHELLGSPIAGSNRQTPTWRSFLRVQDVPWLEDHKLGSDIVLPGAGYVAMAIEAARLLADPTEESIEGYRLREIEFINALRIPDTPFGVEVQTVLSPRSDRELESKAWWDFEMYSVSSSDDSWLQHCKGTITAQMVNKGQAAVTKYTEPAPLAESFFPPKDRVSEVAPEAVFAGLRAMNLFHGPVFQNIVSSRATATKSLTTLSVSSVAAPAGNTVGEELYVIHPTTLDSLIAATFVSIPETTRQNAMAVPRSIRHMYVPRSLGRNVGETITTFTDLAWADRRGAQVSSVAVNGPGNDATAARFELDDLYCQAMPLDASELAEVQNTAICSHPRWEVDISHGVVPEQFQAAIRGQVPFGEEERGLEKRLDRVSFNYISDAVKQLSSDERLETSLAVQAIHLQRMRSWMETVVSRAQAGELGPGSRMWSKTAAAVRQKQADDLTAENAAGQLISCVGPLLADIVRGKIDVDAVLREGDLLDRYYDALPRFQRRNAEHLHQLVAQLTTGHLGARVLEIGGRNGTLTARVLEAFAAKAEKGESGTLLGHYDFTDVVADSFELVKQNTAAWGGLLDFKKLDIKRDPSAQGFSEAHYDLVIIAPGALLGLNTGTREELQKSLRHVRGLLKHDGKLALIEVTSPRLDTQLVFGGLPGWFQSDVDDRGPLGPCGSWDEMLKTAGFSGIDVEIKDCEDTRYQASSVILSSATKDTLAVLPSSISIVYKNAAQPAPDWLNKLQSAIQQQTGAVVVVECLESLEAQANVTYVFTPELEAPFIDNMDETEFGQLKSLVVQGHGLLWLSRSSTVTAAKPDYGQAAGFLRVARAEDTTKRFVSLDFEVDTESWSLATVPYIVQVLLQSFDARVESTQVEWEYAVQNGMLHVLRTYPSAAEDRASSERPVDPEPVEQALWQPGRPLVWDTVQTRGTLSKLYFADDAKAAEPLPTGYVEVETKAMGLNFRDVLVALGQIDEARYMHDAAGVISRLGPETEASGLKVGDRVIGLMEGRFATHPRSHWKGVSKMPEDMSWEHGAAIPCIFMTSYLCLFDVARLQPGERVLIHAGSGGVGQVSIMMAQHAGAEVFATCSSEAKRDLLMKQYGLDSDHILSSRDTSFAAAIRARTGGKGVDVVVNSLSGDLLSATWDCMARFGRFVEIGKTDMEAARRLNLTPLSRNAMIVGFDLIQWSLYKREAVYRAWQGIMKLWSQGDIRPIHPVVAYPITEMETALRRMQRGAHVGKLVLVPEPDTRFRVLTRTANVAQLDDPNATYLLVGGLGGIGAVLAEWMMARGAHHILLISRRGEAHPRAQGLVAHGKARGCNVVIRNCDVSQEDQLASLLKEMEGVLPPIRGVVQAAMALHDTILQRLTFEQWQASIQPKVAGSRNLHRLLPRDLRFFVMLSSAAGVVGLVAQANYCAGNTFQDALARHRAALGLPAVAIDLPAVDDVGVITESSDVLMRSRLERMLGSPSVPIGRVLRLIEAAIMRPLRTEDPNTAQVITGVVSWDRLLPGSNPKRDRRFWTMWLSNALSLGRGSAGGKNSSPDEVLKQELSALSSGDEANALVLAALTRKVAALFNLVAAEIEVGSSLSEVGVDSLVAVELRNWLGSIVQAKVTVFEILQTPTMRDFAKLVVDRSALVV